jgi:hypothetical protein
MLLLVHGQRLPGPNPEGRVGLHLLQHGLAEGVEPPLLYEPEEARLLPVFAVAVVAEDLSRRKKGAGRGSLNVVRPKIKQVGLLCSPQQPAT